MDRSGSSVTLRDELEYASVSSNRNENNISCSGQYLLYSRCSSPIVFNLQTKLLAAILVGHKAEVNGQSYVKTLERKGAHDHDERYIHVISTAHDSTAILWRLSRNHLDQESISSDDAKHHLRLYTISSPDGSIFMTRCSLMIEPDKFLSVLTTMEGNICLYDNDQLLHTIPTKNCHFDSKFYVTNFQDDGTNLQMIFVALAASDNKLHMFHLADSLAQLDHLMDLSGFNDWIKCLDFYTLPGRHNEFLLATACQDSLIQVWHMRLTKLDIDETTRMRTSVSKCITQDISLTSTLETVLSGHEGFVHSLCWFRNNRGDDSKRLQLISCSSDRTIVIWRSLIATPKEPIASGDTAGSNSKKKKFEQSPASEGVWREFKRLGETGEANLPFLGVCLANDEATLYAQSMRGAIHSWSSGKSARYKDSWAPDDSITGHFEAISDLAWERTGAYLLSSSFDKTCRFHAIAAKDNRWHELARPQVHGYEINCLASLNFSKFASGAEEKTIRTFEVTKFFVKNFKALAGHPQLPTYCATEIESTIYPELPAHAQLPALGLSNRGSQCPFDVNEDAEKDNSNKTAATSVPTTQKHSGDTQQQKQTHTLSDNNSWHEVSDLVHHLSRIDHLDSLPFEEILLQSTLWWEKNKLFGHCNELHALACDSTGTFLASASKANRSDLASVIVWDTEKFRKIATIEHHSLTITRLRFSPDDKYLLSVSRDRTWCLCERSPSGQLRNAYKKLTGTVKSNAMHERIIWDCAWTYDSKYFLTVSRDKKAILWSVKDLQSQAAAAAAASQSESSETTAELKQQHASNMNPVAIKLFDSSIQAADSTQTPVIVNNDSSSYLFALGFENGSIELHLVELNFDKTKQDHQSWQLLKSIANFHQLPVRRLAFQPTATISQQQDGDKRNDNHQISYAKSLLLASGGDDCVVRLTRLYLADS